MEEMAHARGSVMEEAERLHQLYTDAEALRSILATRLIQMQALLAPTEAMLMNLVEEGRHLAVEMVEQLARVDLRVMEVRREFEAASATLGHQLSDMQLRLTRVKADLLAMLPEEPH